MPLFQTEVEFASGAGMEREIICGGPDGDGVSAPQVLRQGGYFPSVGGDVDTWLTIKPGSVRMVLGDVYATLQFGGTAASFNRRCQNNEIASLYLSSTEPFTVTVRFHP